MGGPHPGPEKIEALRSRPGLEQFLKSLQVILTQGRGRETQEDARFGGEAVTSVRPRRPRRRLQRPPGQRRHGDRGPRLCGRTPRAPVQLATDHTCGLWARVGGFPLRSRSQGGTSITGREGSGSRPGGRRCPLPHPRGVPCSAATPFPAPPPRSPGTRGHPPSTRFSSPRAHDVLPATREIRGGDSCHARPPERRRGTQGDGARPHRPERSPPRCRSAHSGTLVVITVIFSCSRFFFSSR